MVRGFARRARIAQLLGGTGGKSAVAGQGYCMVRIRCPQGVCWSVGARQRSLCLRQMVNGMSEAHLDGLPTSKARSQTMIGQLNTKGYSRHTQIPSQLSWTITSKEVR